MTDYWKSNDRKHCSFCNCWISDNKPSIAFHENGKRHKMNVAKRISEVGRNSEKAEQERRKMDADIRKMEQAAMKAYTLDIHARGDMTANVINAVRAAANMDAGKVVKTESESPAPSTSARARQQDPLRLVGDSDDEDESRRVHVRKVDPEEVPNASLWVEAKSDEGYTYYWNVKTNETVWEKPKEGFLSLSEYEKINEIAIQQQEMEKAIEAKKFAENANEEVARYNRERLKLFRRPETLEEKKQKIEEKASYKTEEEVANPEIGGWQVVEQKPPSPVVDLELPKMDNYYIAPVVTNVYEAPPVKRFKEKTIDQPILDEESETKVLTTFKKRKFAAKGNARKRLDDD